MKKKRMLIYMFLIICFVLIIVISISSNKNINNNKNEITKKGRKFIDNIQKIDGKSIIYITGDKEDGAYVEYGQKVIDYYKNTYHLNYITFNVNDYSNADLRELSKVIGITENSLPIPTLALYSKEKIVYIVNFFLESDLRKILISNNYLTEEDLSNDIIVDDKNFDEVFSGNNVYIFVSNRSNDYYKYREYLCNNYCDKITIHSSTLGFNATFGIYKTLQSKLKDEDLDGNCLLLVSNNKIIDYIVNFKNTKDIDRFMKKHKVVKD